MRETQTDPAPRRVSADQFTWLATVPAVLVTIAAMLWLAPPLSEVLYPETTWDFFAGPLGQVMPEPVEDTRFLLALAAAVLLAGLVLVAGRTSAPLPRADPAVIAVQAGWFCLVIWALVEQRDVPSPLPASYEFDPAILPLANLVAGALIGIALTAAALRGFVPARSGRSRPAKRSRRISVLAFAAAAVLTALWLLPAIFQDGNIARSQEIVLGHTHFHIEEYWAVLNSRTPLVNYIAQYSSLMPLVFAPVMSLLGPSITSFTVTMTVLSMVALLAVYATFALITERPWAALVLYLPFLALALFPVADDGIERSFNANLYSMLPGRYLGPLLVAWLCARVLTGRGPKPWLVFAAAGLTLLNNAEFGIPCLAATALALWLGPGAGVTAGSRARALARQAVLGLVISFAAVSVLTLIRASALPDLSSLVYFVRLFGRQGFGLLPMPTLGLHTVMYLTYVAALLTAVVGSRSSATGPALTGMLAFSGLFGLGTGAYYAGRSASSSLIALFPAWGLALALLALAAALALHGSREGRGVRRVVVPALAAFIGFGVMLTTAGRFPVPWVQIERIYSASASSAYDTSAASRFVAKHTVPEEPVTILSFHGHAIAERAGVIDTTPFTAALILTDEQMDHVVDVLREEDGCRVFTNAPHPEQLDHLRAHGFAVTADDPLTGVQAWRDRSPSCALEEEAAEGPSSAAP